MASCGDTFATSDPGGLESVGNRVVTLVRLAGRAAAAGAVLRAAPGLGLLGGMVATHLAALSPNAILYTGVLGFLVGVMVRDAAGRHSFL